ncbi:hypothetical protein GCM10027187_02420 [Streptosporangium sandarakinum]|uniref:Uncharacterized protein n=1 Tax=Streptosporangium sandarakinum TaxID=1260955 RepID=A0A852UXU3_9ACTN|nr:hypothetical protein [Streptosporangium sandarakinum]NYF40456.1 hypothetical protein [Streptosporangium sandarakinum]
MSKRKSTTNVTTSGWTAVQVGRVVDSGEEPTTLTPPRGAASGTVTNVRSGNARVGLQADEVRGGLTIRMPR